MLPEQEINVFDCIFQCIEWEKIQLMALKTVTKIDPLAHARLAGDWQGKGKEPANMLVCF